MRSFFRGFTSGEEVVIVPGAWAGGEECPFGATATRGFWELCAISSCASASADGGGAEFLCDLIYGAVNVTLFRG